MNINPSSSAKGMLTQVDRDKLQNNFLTLLVAQMKYSDPLEPPDNLSFTEQLATFAMMDQIAGINSKLTSLTSAKKSDSGLENVYLLAPYINHKVEARSDKIYFRDGHGVAFYDLKGSAEKVRVDVIDNEKIIYSAEIGSKTSGFHNFDVKGVDINDGKYDFRVNAFNKDGKIIEVSNVLEDKVSGINLGDGNPLLMVGNLVIDPSNIVKIE